MTGIEEISPDKCPLCGSDNSCGNIAGESSCWCADPEITFPESLLEKVPQELRKKACICRACVLKHSEE